MAFDVTALTAYIEDQDFPLIAQMQATGGLANKVNIQTGIKGSSNLQFLDTDVIFQDGSACTRTGSATTAFTQRTLTVGSVTIAEDLCIKDLNGYWLQTKLKQGFAGEQEVPADIETIWLEQKMNKIQNALTISDFQGDTLSGTNNLSYYDGLLKIVDAAAGVVPGNTGGVTVATTISTSNILAILDAMWTAIPENIVNAEDLTLWLPVRLYKMYVVALKNANLFHYNGDDKQETLYGTSLKLGVTVGLPSAAGSERMIIARDSNITIGMDGNEEEDDMKVRLDPVTNKKVLFDVDFKRGVQIAFPDEIVEFTLVP